MGVSYFQTNPYPKVLCLQWFFSEWSLQRPWKIQPVWAVSVKGLLFSKLGCFRFSAQKQTPPVQFIPNMAQLQFCGFIPPLHVLWLVWIVYNESQTWSKTFLNWFRCIRSWINAHKPYSLLWELLLHFNNKTFFNGNFNQIYGTNPLFHEWIINNWVISTIHFRLMTSHDPSITLPHVPTSSPMCRHKPAQSLPAKSSTSNWGPESHGFSGLAMGTLKIMVKYLSTSLGNIYIYGCCLELTKHPVKTKEQVRICSEF